jgi:hypothetical protein
LLEHRHSALSFHALAGLHRLQRREGLAGQELEQTRCVETLRLVVGQAVRLQQQAAPVAEVLVHLMEQAEQVVRRIRILLIAVVVVVLVAQAVTELAQRVKRMEVAVDYLKVAVQTVQPKMVAEEVRLVQVKQPHLQRSAEMAGVVNCQEVMVL